jgi:hypothetical protein
MISNESLHTHQIEVNNTFSSHTNWNASYGNWLIGSETDIFVLFKYLLTEYILLSCINVDFCWMLSLIAKYWFFLWCEFSKLVSIAESLINIDQLIPYSQ